MSEITEKLPVEQIDDLKTETIDLTAKIAEQVKLMKEKPIEESKGENDVEQKEEPAPVNPYDKKEETVDEEKEDPNAFGSKLKVFLKNSQFFVGMLSGLTELAMNWGLMAAYKSQVDPDSEIAEYPALKKEIITIENTKYSDEQLPVVERYKSQLMIKLESIDEKMEAVKKYQKDIEFTDEEREMLKALFEHKFSGTDLAKYVEKYPVASVVVGILLKRAYPIGQAAVNNYMS